MIYFIVTEPFYITFNILFGMRSAVERFYMDG